MASRLLKLPNFLLPVLNKLLATVPRIFESSPEVRQMAYYNSRITEEVHDIKLKNTTEGHLDG